MKTRLIWCLMVCAAALAFTAGCKGARAQEGNRDTSPVPTKVEPAFDSGNFRVAHPDQFPLATAGEHVATPELSVTGVVTSDVSRQVPVPSLATGRVVEINARLGDTVRKGQLLFKVNSTDIAGAYSDYRKAVKNEQLAKVQLARARILFDGGAIPKAQLEIAQNAEDNAIVDVETTVEHLRLLGADPDHPTAIVNVYAPVAGVITDQQITNQSGVQALTPPNPFTISDISRVWVICDVYENNMSQVHIGEPAEIHLAAYPDRLLRGSISNILPIVDPNIRTAKVRLEVENPGLMRLGMFVTATFHGRSSQRRATVPATAVLHLHDREWVFIPNGSGGFRRIEVTAGAITDGNLQEILSGLQAGDKVVANALVFQNTVDQ